MRCNALVIRWCSRVYVEMAYTHTHAHAHTHTHAHARALTSTRARIGERPLGAAFESGLERTAQFEVTSKARASFEVTSPKPSHSPLTLSP